MRLPTGVVSKGGRGLQGHSAPAQGSLQAVQSRLLPFLLPAPPGLSSSSCPSVPGIVYSLTGALPFLPGLQSFHTKVWLRACGLANLIQPLKAGRPTGELRQKWEMVATLMA